MGQVFEKISVEYLTRLTKQIRLPFIPHTIGRWWGTNPKTKEECDIDILALDTYHQNAIFCNPQQTSVSRAKLQNRDCFALIQPIGQYHRHPS